MRRFCSSGVLLPAMALAVVLSYTGSLHAATPTLKEAVEAAWAKQPEAQASAMRQDELSAKRSAASSLFPGPPSIELAQRTDRYHQDIGLQETEAAISAPLWMPGTRDAAQRLATVESSFLDIQNHAAKLKVAGDVREAYWQARYAKNDLELAERKVKEAAALLQDVERRFKAGDLARTDLNFAKGTAQLAQASLAQAHTRALRTASLFSALTGMAQLPDAADLAVNGVPSSDSHPQIAALHAAVQVQFARLAQASAEKREPPEVSLGWQRERSVYGADSENSVRLGVRIPLASRSLNASRVSAVNADLIEAQAALRIEQDRIQAEIDAAQSELAQAQTIETLANERYKLATDTQMLHAKAFQLGELDLPTRLRSENERFDAELALSRARLEVQHAISRLNQALGLLP